MRKTAVRPGTLYLIDGNGFFYRAYYAIQGLTNSKGEPTNAIYGFITSVEKLIGTYQPDYLAVCFDRREATFRHDKYEEYKANRKPMPEDLVSQVEPIKEYCKLAGIACFEKAGFEADDLIGTMARRGKEDGLNVVIASSDKDMLQLVEPGIRVLNFHKDQKFYDEAAVRERFEGLGPEQIVDLMALMGDGSDNIPGVPGVGEKTALKLMKEFHSVDSLRKNVEKVASKSQREKLISHDKDLLLSRELATIEKNVEMDLEWDALCWSPAAAENLLPFYKRYEFYSLLRGLEAKTPSIAAPAPSNRDYRAVESLSDLDELVSALSKQKAFSFDTETTSADPMKAVPVGLSFCWEKEKAWYVPVSDSAHAGPGLPSAVAFEALRDILESEKILKYGQNIKYDAMVMKRAGVEVRGMAFDTMIASYLVQPIKRNHNLDDLAMEYLSMKKVPTSALLGEGKNQITMDLVPLAQIKEYACEDADAVWQLVPILKEKLKEYGLEKLFEEIDFPLAEVLARCEMNGVKVNSAFLHELSIRASREIETLEKSIFAAAGGEFNLDSPKQLAEVLFEKLKLPTMRKTKTGFSTDAAVLEKLAAVNPVAKDILEYREKAKLQSTYLDALPEMINEQTGLVHTSYHQTTTDTGRLSSTEPNLQNIPIKTETGRLVRKAFVSRFSEGKIVSADYSQIELRVLAHVSNDPNLKKAFEEDRDIHAFTATLLYGVKEKEVTREMRYAAKTINFSVIYGKTSFGLSGDLGISISEADEFIKNYFARYPKVHDFLEGQKELARKQGWLTTILGRRSYFPNIHSKNMQLRNYAERAAINAPIQGSAADLVKIAMIRIHHKLESEKWKSLMIMQVHDELVFDSPADEVKKLEAMIRKEMESAYELKVPLRADSNIGDSWYKQ
ncbi:MAG TPA: DNA polymerase I [Candidatus Omnitrophota bacterium]|nr:DNA polymerase I [Candidatus Omnitrophota bacterium]